jgi:hypothetical protein
VFARGTAGVRFVAPSISVISGRAGVKMRQLVSIRLLVLFLLLTGTLRGEDTTPVAKLVDFTRVQDSEEVVIKDNLDVNNATIASVGNAQRLVTTFLQDAKIPTPAQKFSCIINVVRWGKDTKTQKDVVTKSNWYVYNPQSTWTDTDLLTNKRIYGVARPYVLAIHLNVPSGSSDDFEFAYKYTAVQRLPTNIQNLQSAISLFKTRTEATTIDMWALGSLEGKPPSDITITPAIVNNGTAMNLQSTDTKFDDEGLYRWDISIGVPIVSYTQLQSIVNSNGQVNTVNIDKRNLLVLGNLFLKPVDVKSSTFLTVPHLVGGISLASKPLHGAMAGLGWGPVISNFYVGAMIITDNLPNNKLAHHYKLAFGLNLPMRTLAAKLGLKTQID